jgi:hypothetical protein
MPDIINPSFEIPGTDYGEASDWTDAQSVGAEDIAQFSDGTRPIPQEAFDGGWDNNENFQIAFGVSDLVHALFEAGSHQEEDFETSWRLPSIAATPIWNHHSVWVYSASNFSYAIFNSAGASPTVYEGFEQRWPVAQISPPDAGFSDDVAVPPVPAGASTKCLFNAATQAYEAFEKNWLVNQDYESAFDDVGGGATRVAAAFTGPANYENFEGAWTLVLT